MKKSSTKQLLMNKTGDEIQVALVEEGRLVELIIERPESRRSIGDIYLGRVHKVVEGLKAAFVDIGQKSDGFLHFSDVGTTNEDYRALIEDDDDDDAIIGDDIESVEATSQNDSEFDEASDGETTVSAPKTVARSNSKKPSSGEQSGEKPQTYTQMIAGKLKPNDSILVQVIKEPISSKGSRLTSDITIAGRFMVLLPFGGGQVAVSRRVVSRKERSRLKKLVRSIRHLQRDA